MEGLYYLQRLFLSPEENRFPVWRGNDCSLHEMLISLGLFIDRLEKFGRLGTHHMIRVELPARVLFF
jgi:hypothetical protein